MVKEPHAFEDDIDIVETVENGGTVFSAFAHGTLIGHYSSDRARNAQVAMQCAVKSLSQQVICEDVLDIAVWFSETHSDIQGYFVIDRYRYQYPFKMISHIVVASRIEVRDEIERIVGEAFEAVGWIIDPEGGSSVEWFDAREKSDLSAHRRLRAVGRVQDALEAYRQTQTK